MPVQNDLLVSKQKNSNPFAPAATNLSGVQTTQPRFSGLSIWTSHNSFGTPNTTSASLKGHSIFDVAKKHTTTSHKSTHLSQKDTEKKAKGEASAEKQKGAAAQVKGKGTTASANANTSDINNRGSNTDSITRSAQSSNNKSMQEIQGHTSRISLLNGQIRANQQQEISLQRQRANTQARLDMLLGTTSSAGASVVKPEADAAGKGNAAGAKGNKPQNTNVNPNQNKTQQDTIDPSQNKFNSEIYSLDTESDRLAKQQKGEPTNAQRNAQLADGHKSQRDAHKFDKKHSEHSDRMHGHDSNNRKSDLDKLDPAKRAEAERLMAELASKDQQIQNKTQQRYRFISNKSNTYNQAQTTNQRQNQVMQRANSNADGTKQTAIQVLGVAQMLHTAAEAVRMVGVGVTAAGHALEAIPYVGPVIGPPVVTVGQTTQHVGEIASNATAVLSKAAGLVKAAVIGDIRAIGMAVVQMTGVMDNLNATNAGDAVQGAASKVTETVGDNMVSRALNEVGEVIKDTGKVVEDTIKTATDTVKEVAQGANDIVKGVTGIDVIGTVGDIAKTGKAVANGVQAGKSLADGSALKGGNSTPTFGNLLASGDDTKKWVEEVLANPTKIYSVPSSVKNAVIAEVIKTKPGTIDKNGNVIDSKSDRA